MTGLMHAVAAYLTAVALNAAPVNPNPKPSLPQPGDVELPPGLYTKATELLSLGKWVVYVVGVGSFFFAAGKIMSSFRSHDEQLSFGPALKVAVGLVIASSGAALADWLLF
jgi:hypothetical protein